MDRTITLTTALALFAGLPANDAAAGIAELILEQHRNDHGYAIDHYVTRGSDGSVLSEATLTDPTTGEVVDVWSDGVTVWWIGTSDGWPVEGSMPAHDGEVDPEPLFCFTPYTAIICIGAILVAAGTSCATTSNSCPARDPIDPSSGIPDDGGTPEGDDHDDGEETGGGDAE